jgi:hypothetical protein
MFVPLQTSSTTRSPGTLDTATAAVVEAAAELVAPLLDLIGLP